MTVRTRAATQALCPAIFRTLRAMISQSIGSIASKNFKNNNYFPSLNGSPNIYVLIISPISFYAIPLFFFSIFTDFWAYFLVLIHILGCPIWVSITFFIPQFLKKNNYLLFILKITFFTPIFLPFYVFANFNDIFLSFLSSHCLFSFSHCFI